MKIALATLGRFWILDLARELAHLGHEVTIWSILPSSHLARFGVPRTAHRGLLHRLWPLVAAHRYGGRPVSELANARLLAAADRLIARRLEPCDVFIGMSGLCVESARIARERHGAKVVIERGSRHIRSQKTILDQGLPSGLTAETVPAYAVTRELAGYDLADRVAVPSMHARQSFLDEGVPAARVFCNPYGVDLSLFQPTTISTDSRPTILYVGAWSYRKGVDVLSAASASLGDVHLVHVGARGDAPLPVAPWFTHVGPVPQGRLPEYYAKAHLFVLASREDGFGLVLSQALACGVPVVCTDRTGGEDLKAMLPDQSWVDVVASDHVDALGAAVRAMLPRAMTLKGKRDLLGAARDEFGWAAYGRRHADALTRVREET